MLAVNGYGCKECLTVLLASYTNVRKAKCKWSFAFKLSFIDAPVIDLNCNRVLAELDYSFFKWSKVGAVCDTSIKHSSQRQSRADDSNSRDKHLQLLYRQIFAISSIRSFLYPDDRPDDVIETTKFGLSFERCKAHSSPASAHCTKSLVK